MDTYDKLELLIVLLIAGIAFLIFSGCAKSPAYIVTCYEDGRVVAGDTVYRAPLTCHRYSGFADEYGYCIALQPNCKAEIL